MKPTAEMIEVAAERLGMGVSEAEKGWSEAPGLPDACFFSKPGRGMGRLLVTGALETLWASSAVPPAQHAAAFKAGRRS